ncbi:class I SAM-dependent methyltransferase [Arenimonas sp.]|uniref:class I SAM-dependent methyltransferase n=1 Tax=Arenimonas sp. TaxID=1872635 RepID=UPI0039E6D70E
MNVVIDFSAIKNRQQSAWASGDYAVVGTTLQIVGERLAEACDLRWDERVLDIAAGNGNATLAAARRGCRVMSTDYVPALLDLGAERAKAERLNVEFRVADAEALPFADASFDAIVSTFGVMFTPDHERAAQEMLRVCRAGGRIGLANWTPEGFIGQMFKVLGRHVAPPAGVSPPSLWGVKKHLQDLFGRDAASISIEKRHFNFRYRSAAHMIEVFRTWYGPVLKAFAALAEDKRKLLEQDLAELMNSLNLAGRDSLVLPSEYAEIIVTRR